MFSLMAAHCMAAWALMGDYDLAMYHEQLHHKLSKNPHLELSNGEMLQDTSQLKNRLIYYNEACFTFLLFICRYIIPNGLCIVDFLEERFEFGLQYLSDGLKKIRSRTNFLKAENNDILLELNKQLGRKKGKSIKIANPNKIKTARSLYFGSCWTKPVAYLEKHYSNTKQLEHRANHISLAFKKIIGWLACKTETQDFFWLTGSGGCFVGQCENGTLDANTIANTFVYCLPNCQKCHADFNQCVVVTKLVAKNMNTFDEQLGKLTQTLQNMNQNTKAATELKQKIALWSKPLVSVRLIPYAFVPLGRRGLLHRREKKYERGSIETVQTMHKHSLQK